MKKGLLILNCLLLLMLVGCNNNHVSVEAYSETYYDLFENYEIMIQEELLFEAVDMINPYSFQASYSNEDFVYYYDEMISRIDDISYELSVLGPKLEDETLMKYQSKLENDLFELMTTMKLYRERQNFNTNAVSRFSLYYDVYHLMKEVTPIILSMQNNQSEIEAHLTQESYPGDESYYALKYRNTQGYSYLYGVLSAQIAAYQDYSGLQVDPHCPVSIQNNDNDFFLTSELDFNVMLNTTEDLVLLLESIEHMQTHAKLDVDDVQFVNVFLEDYITTYKAYAGIRSNYAYNFFKSGEFKMYQVKVEPADTVFGERKGITLYGFDETLEAEHHFLQMEAYFYELILRIYDREHDQFMNYKE